jgi:hypothetical protein
MQQIEQYLKVKFTDKNGNPVPPLGSELFTSDVLKRMQGALNKIQLQVAEIAKRFAANIEQIKDLETNRINEYEYRRGLISDHIGLGRRLPRPGAFKEFTSWWFGLEKHGDLNLWDALSIPITEADLIEYCEYKERKLNEELEKRKKASVLSSSQILKPDAISHVEIIEKIPEVAKIVAEWKSGSGKKIDCASFCQYLCKNRNFFLIVHKRSWRKACKTLALQRYGFDIGATIDPKEDKVREKKIKNEITRMVSGIKYGTIPKKHDSL